jgi:hypothetical protein
MEFHNKSGTKFGGGTLHVHPALEFELTCLFSLVLSWFCWILEYWGSGYSLDCDLN